MRTSRNLLPPHARRIALAAAMSFACVNAQTAVTMGTVSVDQNPPKAPDGALVPTSKATSGDGICWADPSSSERVITGEFGEMSGHASRPHAGTDIRGRDGEPLYAVADGCVSFGNPTAKQLVGVKIRINDKFPNSSVWYLHMTRVAPKFINDGRSGACIPVKQGELVGYSGNYLGSNGKVTSSGSAHLHLSYYASGLMLNPLPYEGAPKNVDPAYNSIADIASSVSGGGNVNDGDASGTRGSKLGFGVPRMCAVYTVKGSGKKTIPYNGSFGTGSYQAKATAPTQQELEDGKQRVRQSMGISPDGFAPANAKVDPNAWGGGMPEGPDWDSYRDMSFEQILHSEVTRRSSNTRWAESLTEQSERGLFIESMWIAALRFQVQHELTLTRKRTDAMLAVVMADEARQAKPDGANLQADVLRVPAR